MDMNPTKNLNYWYMNKLFSKKVLSNVLFVIAIGLLLYPQKREWCMSQIDIATTIENTENV